MENQPPNIISTPIPPGSPPVQPPSPPVASAELPSAVTKKNFRSIIILAFSCIIGAVILALLGSLFSQSSYIATNLNTQQVAPSQKYQDIISDTGESTVLKPVNIDPERPNETAQNVADISRLVSTIKRYIAENHNRVPRDGPTRVIGHYASEKTTNTRNPEKTWLYFYDQYLLVNDNGEDADFISPDGRLYSLNIIECAPNKAPVLDGDACTNQSILTNSSFYGQDRVIDVVLNASCNEAGNFVIARPDDDYKIAVIYKTIDNNIICESN